MTSSNLQSQYPGREVAHTDSFPRLKPNSVKQVRTQPKLRKHPDTYAVCATCHLL